MPAPETAPADAVGSPALAPAEGAPAVDAPAPEAPHGAQAAPEGAPAPAAEAGAGLGGPAPETGPASAPDAAPETEEPASVPDAAPETEEPASVPDAAPETETEPASVPDAAPGPDGPAVAGGAREGDGRFTVRLANFEGPFDLLLQLIAKHKMDVTEVALSKVTDEFMAHIRSMGADWDLDQTTEFLVVAATLLDLKAARLLPAAEVEDEADLALLEARDLLFARLLQYRAYKRIAEIFERRLDDEARRFPRTVGLEPHHADLLPDVVISIGAEGFARLAVKAMQPKPKPQVYVDHIHAPLVSVREQAEVVVALLRERGTASFRELTEGVDDTLTVVARFLALLELYREKVLVLDQPEALGELTVTWAAGDGAAEVTVTDEFDQVVEEKE
ncbi:segregation and condensation protein A [Streptomyces sp. t39]|uniref:segregation and condensation protein A n=1 Tax=Streptomyces sp. t39 TaxID=1828156 RepID=UPI0029058B4B|nr:segregation/condensation protein A [Streptomyces sp. t39]